METYCALDPEGYLPWASQLCHYKPLYTLRPVPAPADAGALCSQAHNTHLVLSHLLEITRNTIQKEYICVSEHPQRSFERLEGIWILTKEQQKKKLESEQKF